MSSGQTNDALELFKLNVSLYPKAWNTYDSLGEHYEHMGNRAQAITNYKRSLDLNPQNTNAIDFLKKTGETTGK